MTYIRYILLLLTLLFAHTAAAQQLPIPPQQFVDVTPPIRTGPVVTLNDSGNTITNGNNLRSAINAAVVGTTIVLIDGVTYQSSVPFDFKDKYAITIKNQNYLPENVRVGTSHNLPKIVTSTNNSQVLDFWVQHFPDTTFPAHDIRFEGIEISGVKKYVTQISQLIKIGATSWQTTREVQPYQIVFDRCYIHGEDNGNYRRAFVFNGAHLAVINSHIDKIHEIGADAQAICGWNGSGPFLIWNNFIEASGENIMFGGADARIPDLVPADGEIAFNTFYKPLSWKQNDPSYAGKPWTVKNHLEFKNGERFLVHDNIFLNCWVDGQVGYSVLFTPRNQEGTNPWARVHDIDFYDNIIQSVGAGFQFLGTDYNFPSGDCRRIRIRDTVISDVSFTRYGGYGTGFVVLGTITDLIIERVQMQEPEGSTMIIDGQPNYSTRISDNDFGHGEYGIKSHLQEGNATLAGFFPDVIFTGNTLRQFPFNLYSNYPNNNFQ